MRAFENELLRKIFGPKRDEVSKIGKKISRYNEVLTIFIILVLIHNLFRVFKMP
jgi:hypothetical protein